MSNSGFYYAFGNIKPNEPVGVLKINESLKVYVYRKMPNRFHRFMARLMLGWVYKQYKRGEDDEAN